MRLAALLVLVREPFIEAQRDVDSFHAHFRHAAWPIADIPGGFCCHYAL